MLRSVSTALFAAALLAPGAALAQNAPAPAAQPAEAAPAAADPTKKVCKKVVTTGYRLRKTLLCATAAEWQTRTFEDRQTTTRFQTRKPLEGG